MRDLLDYVMQDIQTAVAVALAGLQMTLLDYNHVLICPLVGRLQRN